jgi:hypothetical protein
VLENIYAKYPVIVVNQTIGAEGVAYIRHRDGNYYTIEKGKNRNLSQRASHHAFAIFEMLSQ